jgi:hypothetical protein
MIAQYCTPSTFRTLACTSRRCYEDYTPNAWEHLDGLGNLLAVLHDSLSVKASSSGYPEVEASRVVPSLHIC